MSIPADQFVAPPGGGNLARLIESRKFQNLVTGLILANAIVLGLQVVPSAGSWLPALEVLDGLILAAFTVELALRLAVHRLPFFRDPWNVFDFAVIGIALLPAVGFLSVLRTLRVLRLLRLISIIPSMRRVVAALLLALPGMTSVVALLILLQYVAAVMASTMFGAVSPEFFGSLGRSWFTLFQVMTVEGWPDVARPLMAEMPMAWIFFVVYLLTSTFAVMNLFVGVIVGAMQETLAAEHEKADRAEIERDHAHQEELLAQLKAVRAELEALRSAQK